MTRKIGELVGFQSRGHVTDVLQRMTRRTELLSPSGEGAWPGPPTMLRCYGLGPSWTHFGAVVVTHLAEAPVLVVNSSEGVLDEYCMSSHHILVQ